MEVYSRPSDSRLQSFYCVGFGRTGDSYIGINMDKCENKNSQMECSAMANGETRSNLNTRKLAGFLMLFYCSVTFHLKIIIKRKTFTSRKFHILLLTDDRAEKTRIQEQASSRVS